MSWLKRHTVTAAVISLLLAGALWLFYPGVPARWVFLGLGAALLLLSLALNAGEARSAMGTRTARYGAGAAVMALLALGIVVAANAGSDYLFVPDGNTDTVKAAVVSLPI